MQKFYKIASESTKQTWQNIWSWLKAHNYAKSAFDTTCGKTWQNASSFITAPVKLWATRTALQVGSGKNGWSSYCPQGMGIVLSFLDGCSSFICINHYAPITMLIWKMFITGVSNKKCKLKLRLNVVHIAGIKQEDHDKLLLQLRTARIEKCLCNTICCCFESPSCTAQRGIGGHPVCVQQY